jgi:hypothetical protein
MLLIHCFIVRMRRLTALIFGGGYDVENKALRYAWFFCFLRFCELWFATLQKQKPRSFATNRALFSSSG